MCGISGVILREGENVEQALLSKMGDSIVSRGPDFGGFYASKNRGLVSRRLKIIDLSDEANQPFFIEEGKIGIVFNGEIYNHRELKVELEKEGHKFRTHSDTEVIIRGFQQWGLDCVKRLNGMFAFAILDQRGGDFALHLARDRAGIKPLFYCHAENRFAFASVLAPLMHLPWLTKEIDERSLFHYLQFSHVPSPASILGQVKQLPPGHILTLKNRSAEMVCFWNPQELIFKKSENRQSEAEWIEEFEGVLERSVRRNCISDVPVGCFLSGGVDSSLISWVCSRLGNKKMQTFSIGYRDYLNDETRHAEKVAEILGTEHHSFWMSAKDCIPLLSKIPEYFDQPFADPTLLPSLLLSQETRKQVVVALSGDGGDELFFGYTYQMFLSRLLSLRWIPGALRKGSSKMIQPLLQGLSRSTKKQVFQQAHKFSEILQYKNDSELFQYFVGMIGPMRIDKISRLLVNPSHQGAAAFESLTQTLDGLSIEDKVIQVFFRTFLSDTVLAKTDRASMAFGLESRVPFLDNEMLEFSSRLPFSLKYRRGKGKYLLRQSLKKKFPKSVSQRKKQGFSVPLKEWFKGDLKFLLQDYLNPVRLKREGVFVPERIQTLVSDHLQGKANHMHLLWSLVCFELWKEKYLP